MGESNKIIEETLKNKSIGKKLIKLKEMCNNKFQIFTFSYAGIVQVPCQFKRLGFVGTIVRVV